MILKVLTKIKDIPANLIFMYRTGANLGLSVKYVVDEFRRIRTRQFSENLKKYRSETSEMDFSQDWFSVNIPNWMVTIDRYSDKTKEQVIALEIGSFEGRSAFFLLSVIPNATLVCVDTWQGADEHKGTDYIGRVEARFDKNIAKFKDRIVKFKGTSFAYYHSMSDARCVFDLIYVDGSHHADDVIVDAVKCFELLKVGGVMIFDDYFSQLYPNVKDNPCSAINSFLYLKRDSYPVLYMGYQVHIRKTKDRYFL